MSVDVRHALLIRLKVDLSVATRMYRQPHCNEFHQPDQPLGISHLRYRGHMSRVADHLTYGALSHE